MVRSIDMEFEKTSSLAKSKFSIEAIDYWTLIINLRSIFPVPEDCCSTFTCVPIKYSEIAVSNLVDLPETFIS